MSLSLPGGVDGFSSRRYQQESLFDTIGSALNFGRANGAEPNLKFVLENTGNSTIRNPQVEINGQSMIYGFNDLTSQIPLDSLFTVEDTLQAVLSFLKNNYYHWLVSTSSSNSDPRTKPIMTYNTFGSGYCENVSQLMASILTHYGYNAQIKIIGGGRHTIGRVLLGSGRELLFDPDMNVIYKDRLNSKILGFYDIDNDQDIVRRYHHLGFPFIEAYKDTPISYFYSSNLDVWNYSWVDLDSISLVLRPSEKIEFPFKNFPEQYYSFFHTDPSFNSNPPQAPPTSSLGLQIYSPSIASFWEEIIDTVNIFHQQQDTVSAIKSIDTNSVSSFTIRCANPMAITDANIFFKYFSDTSSGNVRVYFRKEYDSTFTQILSFIPLGNGSDQQSINLFSQIHPVGTPITHAFFLKFEWVDSSSHFGIDSVSIDFSFQFNPNAFPRFKTGLNDFKLYSTDGSDLSGLQYSHTYISIDSITVPPAPSQEIFPPNNSVVNSTQFEFQWEIPSGISAGNIADYHIQVSERPDFLFPVSSTFNKFSRQAGNGVVNKWKIPQLGLLVPNTKYYWRVATKNSDGVFSAWSNTWSFTINAPGIPLNLRTVESGDSLSLVWDVNLNGKTPNKFIILGSNIRGFSFADSVIVDTVTTNKFILKTGNKFPEFVFYRVIALDENGIMSGMSDQRSLRSYYLFTQNSIFANIDDTLQITYKKMEPSNVFLQSWSIYQQPTPLLSIFKDSVTITNISDSTAFLIEPNLLKLKVKEESTTPVIFSGRTTTVPNFSRSAYYRKNHFPTILLDSILMLKEDSLFNISNFVTDVDGDQYSISILQLPSWLHYDSIAKTVYGTPKGENVGDTSLVVKAVDRWNTTSIKETKLIIQHTNHTPIIATLSDTLGQEDSLFTSKVYASDVDSLLFGDQLRYFLTIKPSWLSIDSITGILSGIPKPYSVGDTTLTVSVNDQNGGVVQKSFTLHILHTNHTPIFTSVADTTAIEDDVYSYKTKATDQDTLLFSDIIRYRLINKPAWISIDSVTGVISGTPRVQNLYDTLFVVEAYDNVGGLVQQQYQLYITHINHIPEIVSIGSFTVQEDSLYRYKVIVEDPDTLIGDVITYTLTKRPSWLSVNSSGLVSGIPLGKNVGDTIVTVRVSDGKGGIASQSYAIKVSHTNHSPQFVTMADTTAVEDSLYTYNVKANDQDTLLFGDNIRYRLSIKPSWLVVDSISGTIRGTPSGLNVLDTIVAVQSYDNKGGISTQQFILRVEHINHEPEFISTPITTAREDSLYTYQVTATDADQQLFGDTLHYKLSVHPSWMDIDSSTGLITGTPKGKNVGDTVVTVRVRDGKGGLILQTFSVTISHTNHAPVFVTSADTTAVEDSLYTYTVKGSDQDSALFGDVVRYRLIVKPIWLVIDSVTGIITGTPNGLNARDTIVAVQSYDNKGGVSTHSFTLTVEHINHPPLFVSAPDSIANEDSLYIGKMIFTDQDTIFNDQLHFQLIRGPTWMILDTLTGIFSGIPSAKNVGDTLLTIRAKDNNGLFVEHTLPIIVKHTNHNPIISTNTLSDAIEDSLYTTIVQASDQDSALFGDLIRYKLLIKPVWLTIDSITGTISGTASGLSAQDTTVTIQVYDDKGGFTNHSYQLAVNHTNHSPEFAYTLLSGQDSIIAQQSRTSATEDSLFSVMFNVIDPDTTLFEDRIRYSLLIHPSWLTIDSLTGRVFGLPTAKNVGDTTYRVYVTDNNGGVTVSNFPLTIHHINHIPSFVNWNPDTVTVEDEIYIQTSRATDNDTILFGDIVRYRLINKPSWLNIDSTNGTISGTPQVQNLYDTVVIVQAYDNAGGTTTQQYTLHITHVNHIPEIVSTGIFTAQEDTLYRYQVKVEDPDTLVGDVFTFTLTKKPSWLTVSSTGLISGTPRGKNVGTDSLVTVRVTDGKGGIASASYNVKVSHTNHLPQFVSIADTTAIEDSLYTYVVNATDQDTLLFGDYIRYKLLVKPLWLTIDSITGLISGTPSLIHAQDTIVAIQTFDNKGGISTQQYTLKVEHINHLPEFASNPLEQIAEDSLYSYQVIATDQDQLLFNDTLYYRLRVSPQWMSIDSTTGLITGTPRGKDVGDTAVTVRVRDGKGGVILQSFNVTVTHTNHLPVFVTSILPNAIEDTLYTTIVRASDQDSLLFGDQVKYKLVIKPTWLTIDSITGTLSGTSSGLNVRDTTVTVQAYDNKGGTINKTFVLTVQHINHSPVFVSVPDTIGKEDSVYNYRVMALDQDSLLFGDKVLFTFVQAPPFLLIDSLTGLISGIPSLVDSLSGIVMPEKKEIISLRKNHKFLLHSDEDFEKFTEGRKKEETVLNVSDTLEYRSFPMSIKASDDKNGIALQQYTLYVHHTNHAPIFTSVPIINAIEDSNYIYSINVFDRDSKNFADSLTVTPVVLPSWLHFNEDSNTVYGIPQGKNAVDTIVTLKVVDNKSGESIQSFLLNVTNVNHAPIILSSADTTTSEEFEYRYAFHPYDSDAEYGRDSLVIEFISLPSWLKFSSDTLRGVPQYDNVGDTVISLKVTDSKGSTVTQQWNLTITPTYHQPVSFTLYKQSQTDTIALDWNKDLNFLWNRSSDGDYEDTLQYTLHIWGAAVDTILNNLTDTIFAGKIMKLFKTSSRYYWTISVTDGKFTTLANDTISFITSEKVLGVAAWKLLVPTEYIVYQNYPNPFNPTTTIRFGVPKTSDVSIEIYNVIGQRIATIFEHQMDAQYQEIVWNASRYSSGVYYAVIRMKEVNALEKEHKFVKKLVLIK
ncbi:MAG: putative Ig domain-containing protein [Bacteroidota bacterium]|nr:putative Ig domain-containing protein [Bacteroidota bacterium]